MATTKKRYLNGEFIADYESTGDNLKDVELTRNILRDRGDLPNFFGPVLT